MNGRGAMIVDMVGLEKAMEPTLLERRYRSLMRVLPQAYRERWSEDRRWEPQMDPDERERRYARWKQAVQRSLEWAQ